MVFGDSGQRPRDLSNMPGCGEKDCGRTEETHGKLQEGKSTRHEQWFLYCSSAYC